MYKKMIVKDNNGVEKTHIILDRGNNEYTSFPADPDNPYYKAFSDWLLEGNFPPFVDEPPVETK